MGNISTARKGDFQAIFSLIKELHPNTRFSRKKVEELYFKNVRNKNSMELILSVDAQIIGFAAISFRNDIQTQAKIGYLSELIVTKAMRGKGYGTKLLKQAIKKAKGHGCKEIHFPSTFKRKKAHKFYQSLGFKKTAYFFWKEI